MLCEESQKVTKKLSEEVQSQIDMLKLSADPQTEKMKV